MSEKGRVIDVKDGGNTVVVSFMRTEACAKCKACMAGFTESEMILEARNDLDAKKGSIVLIELPEKGFFTATVITYVIPLFAMLAGFLGGGPIARRLGLDSDLFAFSLGIGLLIISFTIIGINEKRIKAMPIFMPYVSEVSNRPGFSEPSK